MKEINIDFRKKAQYITINNNKVYVWLYKEKNYIGYGINGTSFHRILENYKNKTKEEIISKIKEKVEQYENN